MMSDKILKYASKFEKIASEYGEYGEPEHADPDERMQTFSKGMQEIANIASPDIPETPVGDPDWVAMDQRLASILEAVKRTISGYPSVIKFLDKALDEMHGSMPPPYDEEDLKLDQMTRSERSQYLQQRLEYLMENPQPAREPEPESESD